MWCVLGSDIREIFLPEYSGQHTFYVDERGDRKKLNTVQKEKIFIGVPCDEETLRELYFTAHPEKDREPPKLKSATKSLKNGMRKLSLTPDR